MTIDFEFNGATTRINLSDMHPVLSFELTLIMEATIIF